MRPRPAALAPLIVATFALAGCTAAAQEAGDSKPATITAHGVGRVQGVPDVLTITLGIDTQAGRATEALAQNNERTQALIRLLKERGVPEGEIKTTQFSIFPQHDERGRRITGYQVANRVAARAHNLKDAGSLVDAAAAAAGDTVRVDHISFEIDDKGRVFDEARTAAVRQAKAQAEQLARAAGVRLGRIRSISESRAEVPPPRPFARDDASSESPVPLEPGTQEITLEVTVIYEIAN